MARNYNRCGIQGNLCRDPEVSYTPGGTAVCELNLASNDSRKLQDGTYEDIVTYITAKVWGATAEACGNNLQKGSGVLVDGKLRLDVWEKDGVKHYKHWINAENVVFLSKPKGKTDDEYSQDPPPRQSQQRRPASGGQQRSQGGQQRQRPPADDGDIPF